MDVNSYQVGGDHYKTADGYEHWDFCLDTPVDYLAGVATKYITRHRKKGGVEDLRKALHYVNKMLMAHTTNRLPAPKRVREFYEAPYLRLVKAAGLTDTEAEATRLLISWWGPVDLYRARDLILALMDSCEGVVSGEPPIPEPVPLAEENHYSPRGGEEQE